MYEICCLTVVVTDFGSQQLRSTLDVEEAASSAANVSKNVPSTDSERKKTLSYGHSTPNGKVNKRTSPDVKCVHIARYVIYALLPFMAIVLKH